jgi:N-acyl-D-amino-acid deacylase
VIDGTGSPAFFADVGIRDGRIASIGKIEGVAVRVLNASNLVVAPGFIDVHTHADEVAEMPEAEHFLRMGVTTIVAGNCGSSTLDFEAFFRSLARTNLALNVASLVGHNSVRRKVMGGNFDRKPTAEELDQMLRVVDRAMEQGAVGLSTGLIYQPGVFSTTEEIIELARIAAKHGGIYATHMRNEGNGIRDAIAEVIRICRETGIRAEISHLKLSGPSAWGQASQILTLIEHARAEGLDITQDQYVYTAASTGISQLIPDFGLEGGPDRFRERLADPAQKDAITKEMLRMLRQKGREDFSYAVVASFGAAPSINGLNIVEASQKLRGGTNLADQVETILEIQRRGGASGVFHGMSEEDLQVFLKHPNTAIACDSGLRRLGEGVPHPRGYGNNARVLGRYVRELGVLQLEDAIRKMTSLPATSFRFKDRGLIRSGAWADVVVFSPDKVRDQATYKDPHHYSEGFRHVVVNGVPVIEDGVHTGRKAGLGLSLSKSL